MEMSGEPWYTGRPTDVFPEEFATFLLGQPKIRKSFLQASPQLLDPTFWQDAQANIRTGKVEDFYPYPAELRFCNAFAGDAAAGS